MEKIDWDSVHRNKFADADAPHYWPSDVRPLSIDGTALFGISQRTGSMFWDGRKLVTENRLARQERVIAWIVAVSSGLLAVIEIVRLAHEIGWIHYGAAIQAAASAG